MKKLALIIICLIPTLSFAAQEVNDKTIESIQEQCAKEKDPLKRQNSCYKLERNNNSQLTLPSFLKETVTV